jgi:ABC-type transport system substrate-binding protein
VEPDLAERWEALDDTTYLFHLGKGVKWHNRPPVDGRELVAEDVKFTVSARATIGSSTGAGHNSWLPRAGRRCRAQLGLDNVIAWRYG